MDRSGRTIRMSLATAVIVIGVPSSNGQSQTDREPLMSDKVFKNVKVLTGLPEDQFMATMGFFSASLGMTCADCHVPASGGDWERYADDTKLKQTARRMIVMVANLNKGSFGGRREVTCYTCHRGGDGPIVTPSLAEQYGPPSMPREPDKLLPAASASVTPDQVLDKYVQALGGTQRLANITSITAKGTLQQYPATDKTPMDLFAKAPGQRRVVVHNAAGDSVTTYDGRFAWISAPASEKPVLNTELTGGEKDGAKLDALLAFPGQIKQALSGWRTGASTEIDNHEVQLVQGTIDGRYPVNFYFDDKTGLLVRMVRFTDSTVGLNPTQIDFDDYREVAGTKMPFRWTVTWTDGRSVVELTSVQANVPIDAAKFSRQVPAR